MLVNKALDECFFNPGGLKDNPNADYGISETIPGYLVRFRKKWLTDRSCWNSIVSPDHAESKIHSLIKIFGLQTTQKKSPDANRG